MTTYTTLSEELNALSPDQQKKNFGTGFSDSFLQKKIALSFPRMILVFLIDPEVSKPCNCPVLCLNNLQVMRSYLYPFEMQCGPPKILGLDLSALTFYHTKSRTTTRIRQNTTGYSLFR